LLPPARQKGFDLKDFEEAGLRFFERRFGPKDTIFTPGDPDDQLYFLLSGTIRLYKIYGDYKEATTALLKDGGVFGKLDPRRGALAGRIRRGRHRNRGWPASRRPRSSG
jgi:CRP-like cAMP-binding protein